MTLVAGSSAFAQTVTNAGMETWRTGTSGSSPSVAIQAPTGWYGLDSLVIADGETYGPFIGAGTNWNAQLFQENTIKHGGSSSAKLITLKQDTLGYFAGLLSNSVVSINVTSILGGGSVASATSYSGGTHIAGRIASVSAWVQYTRGKDSTGSVGLDSGSLTVNVYSVVHGVDSIVGTGTVNIGPSSSFHQVTANVNYVDSADGADTVRILFASSGQSDVSDSSVLYVDDVTMVYSPTLGVKNVAQNDVKVYPNPASGMLNVEGDNAGANFTLFSVNGQVAATKTLTGKDAIDLSDLADGLYFYTITDADGATAQHGKVSVIK